MTTIRCQLTKDAVCGQILEVTIETGLARIADIAKPNPPVLPKIHVWDADGKRVPKSGWGN